MTDEKPFAEAIAHLRPVKRKYYSFTSRVRRPNISEGVHVSPAQDQEEVCLFEIHLFYTGLAC